MNICFLMYPWHRIDPESDTSIRLIHECVAREHRVAITTPSNLTIRDSVAHAFCDVIAPMKVTASVPAFYRKAKFNHRKLPLSGFDAIFMRVNPPLDSLSLNFLDQVRADTFICNDIDGLRVANNKLYTASFYDPGNSFIPITHVSKNREYLERVISESDRERMILKPLNGYGGRGVIVLEKSAKTSLRSLLDFYIGEGEETNYVILQEFVKGAENGDIRVLMLNGEPIGAMRRVPAAGEARSNVHVGGTAVKHTLTREEKALCKVIGPQLVRDGLFFVGLDIISGKLIEVNVLSPGGITRINRLNRVKLQANVIDFVESMVTSRERLLTRKSHYRKVIEDAHTS